MTRLHSPHWHRVAELVPHLSPQLRVRRQRVRGEIWYVMSRGAGTRNLRLNRSAYAIAARFDGRRSVAALWEWLLAQPGDPPTQDDVVELLAQLREAALVQFDRPADFEQSLPHLERVRSPRARSRMLAWRVPLADPSALLDRLRGLPRLVFSRPALALWAAGVALLVLLAWQHAPTLLAHGSVWLATPRFAALAAVLYLPVKLAHELGHAMAVRRFGGDVHEAGVTLMLLLPVPYVDASAASGFARRRERLLVAGAGMMLELGIAALALPLWLWLDDGWARDAAFATLVITGVSTLVFNANPLQRLDGYYLLTDLLELPNLGPRSRQWWIDQLRRRLLRAPSLEPMPLARGEAPWLALYAPLAWLYGLGIAALAVAWLGGLVPALGVVTAVLLGWQVGLQPAARIAVELQRSALAQRGTAARWRRAVWAGVVLLAAVLLVPVPRSAVVQGLVWPPDEAQLRADEAGFVEAVLAHDGQPVEVGDLVLQLANPALQAELTRQAARVAALEAELYEALPGEGPADARAGNARAELAAAQAQLQRLQERVASLAVRARSAGRVALAQAADLPARYITRGSLLGQVLRDAPPVVRVALPQAQARELSLAAGAVSVRLAGSAGVGREAMLLRDGGSAVLRLPSAALSARHGGSVQTDPRDADDLTPLQPVVLVDVRLAGALAQERIGERAWVRFDAGWSPLALQLADKARHRVLRGFDAGA